jgi:hypothetical protein
MGAIRFTVLLVVVAAAATALLWWLGYWIIAFAVGSPSSCSGRSSTSRPGRGRPAGEATGIWRRSGWG